MPNAAERQHDVSQVQRAWNYHTTKLSDAPKGQYDFDGESFRIAPTGRLEENRGTRLPGALRLANMGLPLRGGKCIEERTPIQMGMVIKYKLRHTDSTTSISSAVNS
jgi:hypothetical protein